VVKKTSKNELDNGFPFLGTLEPIVTSLKMKEKIYLNVQHAEKHPEMNRLVGSRHMMGNMILRQNDIL
jgi:hypothetical protein